MGLVRAMLLTAAVLWAPTCLAQKDAGNALLRGIVRAVNIAWISSDLGLRIESLPFNEGQSFQRGDVLVAFDCRDLRADAQSAEAKLQAAQLTYDNDKRLAELNAGGGYEVELSAARVKQAAADVAAATARTSRCVIRAPFNGRVAQQRAQLHEMPARAEPMLQIVDRSALEIDMLLPAHWLRWLKPGVPFTITLDETGGSVRAEVLRTAAVVDPVSQTVKVIGRFTRDASSAMPGMSGPVVFQVPGGG